MLVEDAAPLMEQLKVCPLEDRWMLRLAVFAFRSIHGLGAACLKDMLMAQDSSSHYNTGGQAAGNLPVVCHARKCGVNSLSNRLVLLWNSLPNTLKSCQSVIRFKSLMWSQIVQDAAFCSRSKQLVFMPVSNV